MDITNQIYHDFKTMTMYFNFFFLCSDKHSEKFNPMEAKLNGGEANVAEVKGASDIKSTIKSRKHLKYASP